MKENLSHPQYLLKSMSDSQLNTKLNLKISDGTVIRKLSILSTKKFLTQNYAIKNRSSLEQVSSQNLPTINQHRLCVENSPNGFPEHSDRYFYQEYTNRGPLRLRGGKGDSGKESSSSEQVNKKLDDSIGSFTNDIINKQGNKDSVEEKKDAKMKIKGHKHEKRYSDNENGGRKEEKSAQRSPLRLRGGKGGTGKDGSCPGMNHKKPDSCQGCRTANEKGGTEGSGQGGAGGTGGEGQGGAGGKSEQPGQPGQPEASGGGGGGSKGGTGGSESQQTKKEE